MGPEERHRLVQLLRHPDVWQQGDAGWELASSRDPLAVAEALKVLEAPQRYPPLVVTRVLDGLIDGGPETLSVVLAHLERFPRSQGGRDCAYVLGEVAYRGGAQRDPRIVPALLQALYAALPSGTWPAAAAVSALRECARSGPLPEARAAMEAVLTRAETEEEPYLPALDAALAVLAGSGDNTLVDDLRSRIGALPEEHGLAIAIREFLAKRG